MTRRSEEVVHQLERLASLLRQEFLLPLLPQQERNLSRSIAFILSAVDALSPHHPALAASQAAPKL